MRAISTTLSLPRWWLQGWRAFSSQWQGGLDAPLRSSEAERPQAAATGPGAPTRLVARTWHGRVPTIKAGEYEEYLGRTGFPDYRRTEGNRGVLALRRDEGGETHFLLITLWDSLESIAEFAGADIEAARYYPEDKDFLLEFEPKVTHYEVVTTGNGE